ncbi:TIR domain-containing protein [bacterium]|nr:TIR domain-containing protein [bacterium]
MSDAKYSVFVSYAHATNQTGFGVSRGWVSQFVDNLKSELPQRLGRPEWINVWSDGELEGKDVVNEAIREAVSRGQALILIHCKSYEESKWCMAEMTTFHELLTARPPGKWVFLVEFEKYERHAKLIPYAGYQFWGPDPKDEKPRPFCYPMVRPEAFGFDDYVRLVIRLSEDIAEELKRLATAPGAVPPPTALVAETTDDLARVREGVRSYLRQQGVRTLPDIPYPRDPDAFRAAVSKDLTQATLFVQLLGPYPGVKSLELPEGYPGLQAKLAAAAGAPVLQWHKPGLDFTEVDDPDHLKLLQGPAVVVEGIEEFKARVVRQVKGGAPAGAPAPTGTGLESPAGADEELSFGVGAEAVPVGEESTHPAAGPRLFVHADRPNDPAVEAVAAALRGRHCDLLTPAYGTPPAAYRSSLNSGLQASAGLVLVCDPTDADWTAAQLKEYQRALRQPALPPVLTVDRRAPFDPTSLGPFLDQLGGPRP